MYRYPNKGVSKAISVLTIVTFLLTNTAYGAPRSRSFFKNKKVDYKKLSTQREKRLRDKKSVLQNEDAAKKEQHKRQAKRVLSSHLGDLSQIHIPSELGRVTDVYQAPKDDSRLIVHIQDLHTNPEAQLNLASILELLLKDYKLGLVCSEGADGVVDTSSVSSFPNYRAREKTARLFIDSGELTGEEYLSITKYPKLPIWGIEDRDIYFENIIEFNKIMKFSPQSQVFISQTKPALEQLMPKIYSRELLSLEQKESDYENEKIETDEYLIHLSSYIQRFNISTSDYKNITLLSESMAQEKNIDQVKIMQESQNLLLNLQAVLSSKSDRKTMDALVVKAQLFQEQKISPFSFYSYLKDLALKYIPEEIAKYPNLNEFIDYLIKVNSLDTTKLFVEMETLTYEVKQRIARTEEQKTLIKALRNIKFLEGFFNLKVSNEELDYYLENRESHKVGFFESFLKPTLKKYKISTFIDYNPALIDAHLQGLEDFYKTVKARDVAMVKNSVSEIEKRNVKVATLIAGGFHTKGITRLLREKGYSYIVVSPYSSTDIDEENYHFLLSGRRKPITQLMEQLDLPEIINRLTSGLRITLGFDEDLKAAWDKDVVPQIAKIWGMNEEELTYSSIWERIGPVLALQKGAEKWKETIVDATVVTTPEEVNEVIVKFSPRYFPKEPGDGRLQESYYVRITSKGVSVSDELNKELAFIESNLKKGLTSNQRLNEKDIMRILVDELNKIEKNREIGVDNILVLHGVFGRRDFDTYLKPHYMNMTEEEVIKLASRINDIPEIMDNLVAELKKSGTKRRIGAVDVLFLLGVFSRMEQSIYINPRYINITKEEGIKFASIINEMFEEKELVGLYFSRDDGMRELGKGVIVEKENPVFASLLFEKLYVYAQWSKWASLSVSTSDLNIDMFRDYDYRSVGFALKPETVFRFGLTWATMALEKAKKAGIENRKVLLARDARKIEPELIEALVAALRYKGFDVIYISADGPNAVTSYSWAAQEYKPLMSIFITASHVSRPKEEIVRGFKVAMLSKKDGNLESLPTKEIKQTSKKIIEDIIDYPEKIKDMENEKKGNFTPTNVDENCMKMCSLIGEIASQGGSLYDLAREMEDSDSPVKTLTKWENRFGQTNPLKGMKVIVEGSHTPSGKLAADTFKQLGADAILINGDIQEVEGEHTADPSKEENLVDVKEAIVKENADFGIAFDLDGDRGAIIVPERSKTTAEINFHLIPPDNLIVALLAYYIEKLGYDPKATGKKVGVIRDVLGTFGVNDQSKRLGIDSFQTDAGYVFLKAKRASLLKEGYVIPVYGERSGHTWQDVTGEFENPIAVAAVFAAMVKNQKYKNFKTGSLNPFLEVFRENTIPYKQSTRFQPLFAGAFLSELSSHRANDTDWVYDANNQEKPPQAIIALGKDEAIKRLQKEFRVGKSYNTPVGKLDIREFKTYKDAADEGGFYRFADIIFELDGKFAGRFIFRASSNDPTFACSFETPVKEGEALDSEDLEDRYDSIGGVVLDWLENHNIALVTGKIEYANKKSTEEVVLRYREKMQKAEKGRDSGDYAKLKGSVLGFVDAMIARADEVGDLIRVEDFKVDGSKTVYRPYSDGTVRQEFRDAVKLGILEELPERVKSDKTKGYVKQYKVRIALTNAQRQALPENIKEMLNRGRIKDEEIGIMREAINAVAEANKEPIKINGLEVVLGSLVGLSENIHVSNIKDGVMLKNGSGQKLKVEVKSHKGKQYAVVGNNVYLVKKGKIDLSKINPIGNDDWFNFFGLNHAEIDVEDCRVYLPVSEQDIVLFPANKILHPSLLPNKVENPLARQMLERCRDGEFFANLQSVLHYATSVAMNGIPDDYYLAQDVLNRVQDRAQEINEYRQYSVTTSNGIIASVSDYLYLSYRGVDWNKWDKKITHLKTESKKKAAGEKKRTLTLYERDIEPTRLAVPDLENWEVAKVEALEEKDLDYITEDKSNPEVLLGKQAIESGEIVSVPFMGGSATTVKREIGQHKTVHKALKVRIEKAGRVVTGWISIAQARIGLIFGQNKNSKVVVVTSVDGTKEGESDRSIRGLLDTEYKEAKDKGQINVSMQKAGLVLGPMTGEPLRFKDGHLATCAENHLWAFLSILMDKDLVMDLLENSSGILSAGNGDNILNYPRASMVGKILKARKDGESIATVAICSPSKGDKKGGFAARVTYRNKETGEEITQVEIREVSEFATRNKEKTGYAAIDMAGEESTDLYARLDKEKQFIEDIFGDRSVAFNVAFYAVDLRLFIARIFGFDETEARLMTQLRGIDSQDWVDRIIELSEKIPETVQPEKKVPNEDNTDDVKGYMTEQAVQDFIVNSMGLLAKDGIPPAVDIKLGDRKDTFLPYKGKEQSVLREDGSEVIGDDGKAKQEYDLIANIPVYKSAIKRLKEKGQLLVLGEDAHVVSVLSTTKDEVIKVNKGQTGFKAVGAAPAGFSTSLASNEQLKVYIIPADELRRNEVPFNNWLDRQNKETTRVMIIARDRAEFDKQLVNYKNKYKETGKVELQIIEKPGVDISGIEKEFILRGVVPEDLTSAIAIFGKDVLFGGFDLEKLNTDRDKALFEAITNA